MALPKTTRAFRRTKDGKGIEQVEDKLPETLQPTQVLIKIHAVSLNFRDVAMLHDRYPLGFIDQGVPCSDAAGTVVAVGRSVKSFKDGDYVCPAFRLDSEAGRLAVGGDCDGVLRDYAIYEEDHVAHAPEHLSHEEVATIACAGVTAWTALNMDKTSEHYRVKSALMEGTGGVSIWALLLCLAAGITPIITSSSDDKLKQAKALGSTHSSEVLSINYKTHPQWHEEVMKLTHGKGVDVVLNNAGVTSLEQNFKALRRYGGFISLIGFLGGQVDPDKRPDIITLLMSKTATAQAIYVGSPKDHKDLCNFLAKTKISLKPVVDKVFDFNDSIKAFDYLNSGAHVGKVVIKL